MYYSAIGLLAIAILLIENHDILFDRSDSQNIPAIGLYRKLLYCILLYYTTDVLWGVLDSLNLVFPLFLETMIHFIAMISGVLLWTQYVVAYLAEENAFSRFLSYAGRIFFAVFLMIDIFNCFTPVLFWIDESGAYHANTARYALLLFQISLFLLSSIHTFFAMSRTEGATKKRYRTICLFGLTMAVMLSVQLYYPLLPLYSIGYMLGTSLLHTFVVADEKDEYKYELAASLLREKRQHEQLRSALQLAYTDSLTGLKNKLAYIEAEEQKDRLIAKREAPQFSIAIFELNELKSVNDRLGHEMGDQYIVRASRIICTHFKFSPVFRTGGDEFVVLLEGTDYQNRVDLKERFDQMITSPDYDQDMIIAMGMADFNPEQDNAFNQVFERADQKMYLRKWELKNRRRNTSQTAAQE